MIDPSFRPPSDPTAVDECSTPGDAPVQSLHCSVRRSWQRQRILHRRAHKTQENSGKRNPHIQRLHQGTPRPRTHHNQPQRANAGRQRDRTHASVPQRRQMAPADKLARRIAGSYRLSLALNAPWLWRKHSSALKGNRYDPFMEGTMRSAR